VRSGALLAALAVAPHASAELDVSALVRHGLARLPRALGTSVASVVELRPGSAAPPNFVHVGQTPEGNDLGVLEASPSRIAELASAFPDARFGWSPPLRLLLDRASGWNRVAPFRNATGLTGRGTVLGIVDTGVDCAHLDLHDARGRSRILYFLDFAHERANLHPELEDALGCRTDPNADTGTPCAVYSGEDVDALLADDDPSNDPSDFEGHGTHVASLAGGSGYSNDPPRYVGVAPEASFVIARVARKGGGIYDADLLKATKFVFERAEAIDQPAVVNLSLGTDFGGHDGSSPVERGLESLVGDDHPGRAIVVAAGNSAGLYTGAGTGAPEPLGVHTEVHVPEGGSALVPIITPPTSAGITEGTIYVWLTLRPGDELALGVERSSGDIITGVPPGREAVVDDAGVEVTIVNGVTSDGTIPQGSYGAAVVIDGRFSSSEVFGLRLGGPASARIWIEGDNGLGPEQSIGPLLPRAQKEGTINVPACSPGLIAVGATVNRTDWPDYAGETVSMPAFAGLAGMPADSTAFFSAAGPNALGVMKPDLVAPGANIVAAMAQNVDPRKASTAPGGMFDDGGLCAAHGYADDCFVVDDAHALSGGTSMSAPLVTGAVALLFQKDPTLTQSEVRATLQAAARRIGGVTVDPQQLGAGALDLERVLEVFDAGETERTPGSATELVLSESYAHPDPSWPLEALIELRDAADHVVDGFDARRLTVTANGGFVVERPLRLAAGLWRFSVAAPAGSGGRELDLDVAFDGRSLAHRSLPIAVDRALSTNLPSARGGCTVTSPPSTPRTPGGASFALLALGIAIARRAGGGAARRRPAPPN
jgi:subtilisin family serine protease